jgi:hypothetical protein
MCLGHRGVHLCIDRSSAGKTGKRRAAREQQYEWQGVTHRRISGREPNPKDDRPFVTRSNNDSIIVPAPLQGEG